MRVAAYNEVPDTPLYTNKEYKTTQEALPERAPVINNVTGVSSTECYLQWTRPDIEYIKGRALGMSTILHMCLYCDM